MEYITPIGTVIGIACLYVLQRWQDGKPIFKKAPVDEIVPAWAQQLQTYFNHDTTEHHQEMGKKLDAIAQGQEQIKELMREHNKLDERVIVLLENQEKYGVKCRVE